MRKHLIVLMALIFVLVLFPLESASADITWTEHNVTNNFDGANAFDVRDINGDNDLDVIASAAGADEIYFFAGSGSGSSYSLSSGTLIYDGLNYGSGIAMINADNQNNLGGFLDIRAGHYAYCRR